MDREQILAAGERRHRPRQRNVAAAAKYQHHVTFGAQEVVKSNAVADGVDERPGVRHALSRGRAEPRRLPATIGCRVP